MYLLLLVFGGVLTVAGIALAASGISLHDHVFDATIVTPGVVSAVGGLVLIGLGLALRVLQRIEQAVSVRPAPRAARPGEPAELAPAAAGASTETARIPFPGKPVPRPPAGAFAKTAVAPPVEKLDFKDKAADLVPPETSEPAEAGEESEPSLPPKLTMPLPRSLDTAVPDVDKAARRRNGAAPPRMAPRLDLAARGPIAAERPRGPAFDSLWPKGPRPVRSSQSAPIPVQVPAPAVVAPAPEPEPVNEASVDTAAPPVIPAAAPEPVSVLKSGVVDGMAYTLYSDGSIEAELPQGTIRFGSITELRNHIEQSA